jgi:hypothetical protein
MRNRIKQTGIIAEDECDKSEYIIISFNLLTGYLKSQQNTENCSVPLN